MTDRITADILVEAFDLALPDFDDLKDRIEEAAAAHKATLTVDGRRYPAAATPVPPPADRAAILAEAADAVFALDYDVMVGEEGDENLGSMREAWDLGTIHAEKLLRRLAAEAQPTTKPETDEDPARIDRLRPEFTEHASVESIDAQLRRARAQERRWHIRTEWLISLRDDRVAQKARGEWPAAGVRRDGAQR